MTMLQVPSTGRAFVRLVLHTPGQGQWASLGHRSRKLVMNAVSIGLLQCVSTNSLAGGKCRRLILLFRRFPNDGDNSFSSHFLSPSQMDCACREPF